MKLRVCITGRNHAAYTEECLRSIFKQQLGLDTELVVDWTDDASNPPFSDHFPYQGNEHRLRCNWNRHRVGGLANFWRAIQRADDDEIVLLMGGDDWLEGRLSFARLEALYDDSDTWLTYGTFKNSDGNKLHESFEWNGCDLRGAMHEFLWMPLTCRAWLAKKVLEEDLKIMGYFQQSSGDVALNVPIVEMAGPEHARWIAEPWYVRRCHDANDTKVDVGMQYYLAWRSYRRPRYLRLRDRDDVPRREEHVLKYGLAFHPSVPNGMPQGLEYGEAGPPRVKKIEPKCSECDALEDLAPLWRCKLHR